jgi:hypothetical protein
VRRRGGARSDGGDGGAPAQRSEVGLRCGAPMTDLGLVCLNLPLAAACPPSLARCRPTLDPRRPSHHHLLPGRRGRHGRARRGAHHKRERRRLPGGSKALQVAASRSVSVGMRRGMRFGSSRARD